MKIYENDKLLLEVSKVRKYAVDYGILYGPMLLVWSLKVNDEGLAIVNEDKKVEENYHRIPIEGGTHLRFEYDGK